MTTNKITTHTAKSGKLINIRTPEIKDAQALLDLKRGYIKNTTTLPLTLDEYPNDLTKEIKLIEEFNNSDNSILLLAEYKTELIGNIDLTGNSRSKLRHTAMLGMGIAEEWRNQGIGKLLIENAIDWAKNNSELEIIWLDVYASNNIGYNLYKKMGFVVNGIIKNFFKEGAVTIDKVHMHRHIN